MRLTEDMRSQGVKCLAVITVLLLVLSTTCSESWGTCTPATQDQYGVWTGGSGDGEYMPCTSFGWAGNFNPSGCSGPTDYRKFVKAGYPYNGYSDCGDIVGLCQSNSMGDYWWYGLFNKNTGCQGGCNTGCSRYIVYEWNLATLDPANHDSDCDGILDIADSFPVTFQSKDGGLGDDKTCNKLVKNPANVATGNKFEPVLDLSISTPGIPLEFRRSYNSQSEDDGSGPLGYRWTHNFNLNVEVIQASGPRKVKIWDSDGRALYFTERSSGSEIIYYGESGVKDRLKEVVSSGHYFFSRKEGNLTYEFGSDGKLLGISDPNGNTLTLTYTSGLLTEISNNFGKSLSIQYTNNRISSITDPKSQSVSYAYTSGDLTSVTYPDNNSISYAYSDHFMTDKYDTDSNLIGHWGYDSYSRVTNYYSHIKDSVHQEEIDLTYPTGKTELRRTIEGQSYLTTYTTGVIDKMVVVQQVEDCSTCGGVNKSFQYSGQLELTDVTFIDGQNQYTTHYVYDNPSDPRDKVGEIVQMTEALGKPEQRITSYTYTHRTDDPFLLTQSTETKTSVANPQQNKVITLTYDNYGNITSRQEAGYILINGTPTPKTNATDYQYNTYGQLTQIDGPRTDVSDIITLEYYANTSDQGNNRGQLKAIVNALNQRTEFSNYDANGNIGTITDPNGAITQRTYDERNRIKTITNQTTGGQTQYFYDIRGNLSYIILPEGNRIDFSYNLANKLTEIKDSLGNKIQYQYDVEGNPTREEIKDPNGTLRESLDFTYDVYNHLKRIINPDTNYTEYSYDAIGNATSIKDPKNNTTSYIYDALSRLTQINQPLSTTTYQGYDTQDNQVSITDPKNNTTQYLYDDFGRKNQTNSPDTGTTRYEYDGAGNLTKRVDANGTTVNYTYDALNRLTAIQFPSDPNQNVTFTYDSTSVTYGIGRLTGRTDPSGSYTFYYDAQGNLSKEEKTIDSILYTTQYAYNKDNNITSITYPTGKAVTYTLDMTGKITQVDTTLNGNPKTLASSISYLPYGGITGLTYGNGLSLSQGYDNQYRTSSIVVGSLFDRTYTYDANGNVTSVDDGEAAGNEGLESAGIYTYDQGTNLLANIWGPISVLYDYDNNANMVSANNWTFAYDLSNQLIRVLDNSNQIAEYTYNGAGQRIKKVTQTETRIFHYDLSGHLIAETNQTGQMLAEYIYLGDLLLSMIKSGELIYYYHNDHLGTPQVLTDNTQTIAWKAVYTPFGEAVASIQTVENPFRFPGQYYDSETGLHYNYFRYYDPTTGRYVTPDPIGLEGGINLFVYVQNNPVSNIDPFGLWTVAIGVSGSVGAGMGASGSVMITFDAHGNIGFIESGGGGGYAGVGGSGGGIIQVTNADSIYDLRGFNVQTGFSFTWGPNIGAEWVVGMGYMGVNINFGLGGGLTPFEMHSIAEYAAVQGVSIYDIINFIKNLLNKREKCK
jgi:RHS repeat-associated protein